MGREGIGEAAGLGSGISEKEALVTNERGKKAQGGVELETEMGSSGGSCVFLEGAG